MKLDVIDATYEGLHVSVNLGEGSSTSLSLLVGLREKNAQQWNRFTSLYAPLLYEWCRRAGVSGHDAADLIQEVFLVVMNKIEAFRRDREGDTFHGWLWGITRFEILRHFQRKAKRQVAAGSSAIDQQAAEIPTIPDDITQLDDDRRLVYQRALDLMRGEFEERTWQAFWKVSVEEISPSVAGEMLGMSVGAVYNAKYKVLRRLRNELEGLL